MEEVDYYFLGRFIAFVDIYNYEVVYLWEMIDIVFDKSCDW